MTYLPPHFAVAIADAGNLTILTPNMNGSFTLFCIVLILFYFSISIVWASGKSNDRRNRLFLFPFLGIMQEYSVLLTLCIY